MDYQTQTTKPNTIATTTSTAFSHFDSTDIKLDSTGHAYLPFHPSSFGFPFAAGSFGSTTMAAMTAMTAMMSNPVPVEFGTRGGDGEARGVMDKLPAVFFEESGLSPSSSSRVPLGLGTSHDLVPTSMMNGTLLMEHINPLALSLQQSRRLSDGIDQPGGLIHSRSRRGSSASSSSSSSSNSSCSLTGGERRASKADSTAVLEGMRRTSEVEVEAALILDDEEEHEEDLEVEEMRVVCDELDGAVVQPSTRVRKRNLKDDAGGSKKKKTTPPKRKSTATTATTADTSNPCSTSTVLSHPDSAFSIPDPPRPFSFKDLGLSPPPPFLGDDGDCELGSSEGEEEDGPGSTGKTGKMGQGGRVRGKRREMNRVAAKRHREKNKDRLKSLEKRKTWLDTALVEYEKSNKRLSETLDRLKRENGMLKSTQIEA